MARRREESFLRSATVSVCPTRTATQTFDDGTDWWWQSPSHTHTHTHTHTYTNTYTHTHTHKHTHTYTCGFQHEILAMLVHVVHVRLAADSVFISGFHHLNM